MAAETFLRRRLASTTPTRRCRRTAHSRRPARGRPFGDGQVAPFRWSCAARCIASPSCRPPMPIPKLLVDQGRGCSPRRDRSWSRPPRHAAMSSRLSAFGAASAAACNAARLGGDLDPCRLHSPGRAVPTSPVPRPRAESLFDALAGAGMFLGLRRAAVAASSLSATLRWRPRFPLSERRSRRLAQAAGRMAPG